MIHVDVDIACIGVSRQSNFYRWETLYDWMFKADNQSDLQMEEKCQENVAISATRLVLYVFASKATSKIIWDRW